MSRIDELMLRDIPERDIGLLRTCFNLADGYGSGDAQDLPHELRTAYWEYKLVHDRVEAGAAIPVEGFKTMALRAGLGKVIAGDDRAVTIAELFDRGEIKTGDPVLFKFGRKEVQGYFQNLSRDRKSVRVLGVGETEVRTVPLADCVADPEREPQDLTPASASKAEKEEAKPKNKGGRPRKNPELVAAGTGRSDIHAGQESSDDDI